MGNTISKENEPKKWFLVVHVRARRVHPEREANIRRKWFCGSLLSFVLFFNKRKMFQKSIMSFRNFNAASKLLSKKSAAPMRCFHKSRSLRADDKRKLNTPVYLLFTVNFLLFSCSNSFPADSFSYSEVSNVTFPSHKWSKYMKNEDADERKGVAYFVMSTVIYYA
jgi:hypothetical protein